MYELDSVYIVVFNRSLTSTVTINQVQLSGTYSILRIALEKNAMRFNIRRKSQISVLLFFSLVDTFTLKITYIFKIWSENVQ